MSADDDPLSRFFATPKAMGDVFKNNPVDEGSVGENTPVSDKPAVADDSGPLAAGLTQFSKWRDILETTLDLMEAEADMICEAADLAVDQVQDMRIAWLEEGPEVELSDIFLQAVMLAAFEIVAIKVAGDLIRRGFRTWSRMTTGAAIQSQTAIAKGGLSALDSLRAARETIEDRIQFARMRAARAAGGPVDLSFAPVGQRTPALRRSVAERRGQREAKRVDALEREASEVQVEIQALQREVMAAERALDDLQKKFDRVSKSGAVTEEALREMVAEPLRKAIPDVSSLIGKSLKDTAARKSAPSSGISRVPKEGEPPKAGDGPSAIVRLQVFDIRRATKAEITRVRSEVTRLGASVAVTPLFALASAIFAIREVVTHLAQPQLAHEEYREAVRDLALAIEFSIWSIVLQLFLDRTRFKDMFSFSGPDVPGFELYLRGAPKRVVRYLLDRFRPLYSAHSGVNDVDRLVEAMRTKRREVKEKATSLLSTLGRDRSEPFAGLVRPAIIRNEIANDELSSDEGQIPRS